MANGTLPGFILNHLRIHRTSVIGIGIFEYLFFVFAGYKEQASYY